MSPTRSLQRAVATNRPIFAAMRLGRDGARPSTGGRRAVAAACDRGSHCNGKIRTCGQPGPLSTAYPGAPQGSSCGAGTSPCLESASKLAHSKQRPSLLASDRLRVQTPSPPCPARRAGFTLVELAMTALLLSLGLLAVFALLRRGLASRMELEAETRGAAFADAAFNTLRFVSEQIARGSTATNDTWGAFWISFGAGSTNLPLTVDSMEEPLDPSVTRTALLYGTGARYFYTNGTTEAHIAYQCSAIGTNAFEGFLEHYPTNRAQVTLHVWPSGLTNAPAQTFFTLFSNPGRLP